MPLLPRVLREIAEKLIADDWFRMETQDGSHSYYIVGARAYDGEMRGELSFTTCCIVSPRTDVGPLGEYIARSQTAGEHRDYLKHARKRLEREGVSPGAIDRFLHGDLDALPDLVPASVSHEESLRMFGDLLDAWRVSQIRERDAMAELNDDERQEVDLQREKLCLKEIVTRYGKIVDWWEQLDTLRFQDQQLEEGSRAYLYGFYRASVVLSAAALEKHLKRITAVEWLGKYRGLVEQAAAALGLDHAWVDQACSVFQIRNKVVHEGHVPSHDEAKLVLGNARGALAKIMAGG